MSTPRNKVIAQLPAGLTLSTQTYEVNGLTGQLAKYNGERARCYHGTGADGEPSQTYHFPFSNKLTLELPRRFLRELSEFDYPVVAVSGWQTIMQNDERAEKNGNQATSNNRQDVRATADSLVMQLRNVLIERGGGGKEGRDTVEVQQIKDLFGEMDSNHNGQLDKKEFLDGCLGVGITISPQEINLMWPLFDLDGNGTIDTDELTTFLEDRRTGRKTSTDMKDISKHLRQDRILNKTAYAARLKAIAESLRVSIVGILAKERITKEELFLRLDLDGGGTLDRSEFLGGLRRLGIPLSLPDMNVLWPMFSLDADGTVSMHEWQQFLDTKSEESGWSYRMTCDIFTTNVQLAPSGLHADLTAAAAPSQPRCGDNFLSAPKRRNVHSKPTTTAAERAVLYASPLAATRRLKVHDWQEEAAAHAPKPPLARASGSVGRRHHTHENLDADNKPHGRHGRDGHGAAARAARVGSDASRTRTSTSATSASAAVGSQSTPARSRRLGPLRVPDTPPALSRPRYETTARREQASCDGEAASPQLLLAMPPARAPQAMTEPPPLRCVAPHTYDSAIHIIATRGKVPPPSPATDSGEDKGEKPHASCHMPRLGTWRVSASPQQPVKRTKTKPKRRSKVKIHGRPTKASPFYKAPKKSKRQRPRPACRPAGDSDADSDADLCWADDPPTPVVARRHHCRFPLFDSGAFTAIRGLGLMSSRVEDKEAHDA
jgi:Ca2+-binding EF-hand superfamily protein